MREISTQLDIAASPERVWQILADFKAYPTWNPFVKFIQGEMKQGAKIEAHIQPPNQRLSKFKPVVTAAIPNKRFSWVGSLPIPGLFIGEHVFELEALPNGYTRLHHFEQFKGLLVGMILNMMEKDVTTGFNALNAALAERAEASPKAE
jgi:hypothetical protein